MYGWYRNVLMGRVSHSKCRHHGQNKQIQQYLHKVHKTVSFYVENDYEKYLQHYTYNIHKMNVKRH
jgi:hypothetical protein